MNRQVAFPDLGSSTLNRSHRAHLTLPSAKDETEPERDEVTWSHL